MIISQSALKLLTKNTQAKNRLASELNCSIHTVERWIKLNQRNGDLTKAIATRIISEETGLKNDKILEDDNQAS